MIETDCALCDDFAGAICWVPAGVVLPVPSEIPDDPTFERVLIVVKGELEILRHEDPELMDAVRLGIASGDLVLIAEMTNGLLVPFFCAACDESYCREHREPTCPSGHVDPWSVMWQTQN